MLLKFWWEILIPISKIWSGKFSKFFVFGSLNCFCYYLEQHLGNENFDNKFWSQLKCWWKIVIPISKIFVREIFEIFVFGSLNCFYSYLEQHLGNDILMKDDPDIKNFDPEIFRSFSPLGLWTAFTLIYNNIWAMKILVKNRDPDIKNFDPEIFRNFSSLGLWTAFTRILNNNWAMKILMKNPDPDTKKIIVQILF